MSVEKIAPVIREYSNGSYSVDGIIYNKYTDQISKVLTIAEAATLANVTVHTFRKWLKGPHGLRAIPMSDGMGILDYEVQHHLHTVVNRVYPKRTWVRALRLLRQICLINRDTLLEKLQQRHDQKWTDLQCKVNEFDDAHVAAYRRGVSDAIHIVKTHAIETWDYVPKIGQRINVGGCGGMITKITDTEVFVSGTYIYSNGRDNDPGHRESWRFSYKLEDLTNGAVKPYWPLIGHRPLTEGEISWDYEGITHNSYA